MLEIQQPCDPNPLHGGGTGSAGLKSPYRREWESGGREPLTAAGRSLRRELRVPASLGAHSGGHEAPRQEALHQVPEETQALLQHQAWDALTCVTIIREGVC